MKLALSMLRMYQRWISPMFLPACRYQPTCSDYAAEAIARYGVFYGAALAAWRLVRCHPFAKGGLDLVPTETRCTHPALIPGQHD
jgi:putative membrane protein insertion efficiency factor